jgi:hypothetical protein
MPVAFYGGGVLSAIGGFPEEKWKLSACVRSGLVNGTAFQSSYKEWTLAVLDGNYPFIA